MATHLVNPAEIVADLYVSKSRMMEVPQDQRGYLDPVILHKYSWMDILIANISDKYDVKYEEVEAALRARKIPK